MRRKLLLFALILAFTLSVISCVKLCVAFDRASQVESSQSDIEAGLSDPETRQPQTPSSDIEMSQSDNLQYICVVALADLDKNSIIGAGIMPDLSDILATQAQSQTPIVGIFDHPPRANQASKDDHSSNVDQTLNGGQAIKIAQTTDQCSAFLIVKR